MKYGINNPIESKELAYETLISGIKALEEMDFDSASKSMKKVLDYNSEMKFLEEDEELMAIEALGISLLGMECYEEGIFYIKAVYDRVSSKNSTSNPLALDTLHSLGEAYMAIGQNNDALAVFRKEYHTRMESGVIDEDVIKAGYQYSFALRLEGKALEAIAIHKDNMEKIEKLHFDCNLAIAEIVELGNCYIALDKNEKALDCFNMAYTFSTIEYTENSARSQDILLLKIKVLARLERFEAVIDLVEKAREIETYVTDRTEEQEGFLKTLEYISKISMIGKEYNKI